AQEVGLILHRGAPAGRHERFEQLAIARLLVGCSVFVQRIEDVVDDARDLTLWDDEVAAPERAAPVRCVRTQHAQDPLGDAALASHVAQATIDSCRGTRKTRNGLLTLSCAPGARLRRAG